MAGEGSGSAAPGVLGLGLAAIAVVAVVANVLVGSAIGSGWVERWPTEIGVWLVLLAVLGASLVLPVGAAGWALRRLAASGRSVRIGRTMVGIVGLWNVALLAATWQLSPHPLSDVVVERGTWVYDVFSGRGPFGPAALPTVETLVADARALDDIGALAPLLSDETAAGVAAYWVLVLNGTGDASPEFESYRVRYGFDLKRLADAPDTVDIRDGRDALADLAALLEEARQDLPDGLKDAPTFQWPADLPAELELTSIDRTHVQVGERPGWEARYEHGEWRLFLGGVPEWYAAARHRLAELAPVLAQVRAAAEQRDAAAAAALATMGGEEARAAVAAEPASFAAVRAVLTSAARGHHGALTGTTAHQASWPESLTREAAVARAETVRAWCVGAAGSDALIATDHSKLLTRYGLPAPAAEEPSPVAAEGATADAEPAPAEGDSDAVADPPVVPPLDEAQRAALDARGRRWFRDVLEMCEPVVVMRQHRDVAPGTVDDGRRARWAGLDATEWVQRAQLSEDGDAIAIDVGGESLRAIRQDGSWRIDWP